MIDPRRLRVLQALADHGTVTAAAVALYLTPSAVSQQLAALESEVGHALLERRGRRVRLTATGDLLVGHANEIAAQLERAEADLAAFASGVAGTVTIGAYATSIATVVAPATVDMARRAPDVTVRVVDAEGHASLPMVLDGEADIAIADEYRNAPKPDDPRIYRTDLFAEPFDALVPADADLASCAEIALVDLRDRSWVMTSPDNPVHEVVQLACEHEGFSP
ncbi:MAG: LysR family transcriptional regulator, partial [Actinomycetia bacterium]|nr:LysR family transcriptional regulator [Actinomycetes bacterium]